MILDRYDPIAAAIQGGISEERPGWYDNFSAAQEDFMRIDSTMSRRFGLQGVWSDITARLNEELGDRYMRLGADVGVERLRDFAGPWCRSGADPDLP